jgi:hypothetical protein
MAFKREIAPGCGIGILGRIAGLFLLPQPLDIGSVRRNHGIVRMGEAYFLAGPLCRSDPDSGDYPSAAGFTFGFISGR